MIAENSDNVDGFDDFDEEDFDDNFDDDFEEEAEDEYEFEHLHEGELPTIQRQSDPSCELEEKGEPLIEPNDDEKKK